ncbi:SDR family NAD(P)-dependent oxidoreductase [Halopseudomonas salegens]|uniref:Dihydromonapterin reductase / dihydrofolate reductase n=1 Tax=Halopseudomonas salegens TaxID=1434072 RepID=A0A1H2E9Y0_9GAMM|nr:SDR family NAD(P)-dependent oxidoreductase [Halopseudomonas salegens]SDT91907.1 dihydromonapterin reductase / dihydrofolate reductase [Halopseudomonas salegens]
MTESILITGCSKRVGHDLALHLQQSGYQIVGVSRRPPCEPIPGVDYRSADLTRSADVDALISHIRQEHPNLRAIIHNASLWLDDLEDNIDAMLALHVATPIKINLGLSELITRAPRFDIINICDDTATRGSKNHVGYAAAKTALLNTTLSFAKLFPETVRVNAISPGLLYLKEGSDESYQAKTIKKSKIQYEPKAEPVITTVDYLLRADFVTGSNIVVNGGRHVR